MASRGKSGIKRILYASHWWLEEMMTAVSRHATTYGWHLDFQMCYTGNIPHDWKGEGIITTLSGDPAEMGDFLDQAACPAVSLNPNFPELSLPRVSIDMEATGTMAAKHFLEREFRSFATYTPHSWHTTELAHGAFAAAVEAKGYQIHSLDWSRERGAAPDTWSRRQAWLSRKVNELPRPIAFFSPEADSMTEFMEACSRESIAIPNEAATLGLHDCAVFRSCAEVPLSCISVDYDEQARLCCELLARMMDGEPPPFEDIMIPPTGIVTRQSSDTIAAQTPAVAKAVTFMLEHFAEPIGVDQAVRASGISRTRLFKAFQSDFGATPHAILSRIRLEQAKKMLRETDAKVHAISQACGFGEPIGINRHFNRAMNMSPSAYRQNSRKQ